MTEQQMQAIMRATVALTCEELSNEELAVLNLTAIQNLDPHGRLFPYEKVRSLFTEANGTRMHPVAKDALAAVVNSRLS